MWSRADRATEPDDRASRSLWRRAFSAIDRLLTTDFCPSWNRYVYWLKQPIGWFLTAVGMSLLVGCFLGPQGFVLAAAIGVVTVLGVVWPWITMAAVRCELTFPCRRAREGERVRVRLRVGNRLPCPVWGLCVEQGFYDATEFAGDGKELPVVALDRVPGWSASDFLWEFQPPARGKYPTRCPMITCGFPFGIWTARRPLVARNQLLVWPRTTPLTSVPPMAGQLRSVAAATTSHAGDEEDFLGVRPYRRGDSLRHIHWAQTARHDRLVICERQGAAQRRVRIIVDPDPAVHVGSGRDGSREWAIRVAASLVEQFHAYHCTVEFAMGTLQANVLPGQEQLRGFLDELARFHAAGDLASPAKLSGSRARGHGRRQHPTILITTNLRLGNHLGPWEALAGGARLIVIRVEGLDTGRDIRAATPNGVAPWIELDHADHLFTQLRARWEKRCHDRSTSI